MFRLVQAITVPYDVMQHCFDRNMISMFIATTWINMNIAQMRLRKEHARRDTVDRHTEYNAQGFRLFVCV